MIVIDAAAAVELLTEKGEVGEWVADAIAREDALGAPHLIDPEVLAALRNLVVRGEITPGAASEAVVGFEALPMTRYPVTSLIERIWKLRRRLTPHDASYVALAEALDLPLLTTDSRLARAGGHCARIVAFGA